MGSLLSSLSEPPRQQQYSYGTSYNRPNYNRNHEEYQNRNRNENNSFRANVRPSYLSSSHTPHSYHARSSTEIFSENNRPSGNAPSIKTITVEKSQLNNLIVPKLISEEPIYKNWELMLLQNIVSYHTLDDYSPEYNKVASQFHRSFKNNKHLFPIMKIDRVQNPFLLAAFLLKKSEIKQRFGQVTIRELFHGTRIENVTSICENNLLRQRVVRHKHGNGISFSPKSSFANCFCGRVKMVNRVMLLVYVLQSKSCLGNDEMELPPKGFDTTHREDQSVFVKYEDNEFYPAYVIYFQDLEPAHFKFQRRKN